MNLDGCVGVNALEEPFWLNGCRQVIVLLGDSADEESFRLISGLDFILREKNCYRYLDVHRILVHIIHEEVSDVCFILGVGEESKLSEMLCDGSNVGGALYIGNWSYSL